MPFFTASWRAASEERCGRSDRRAGNCRAAGFSKRTMMLDCFFAQGAPGGDFICAVLGNRHVFELYKDFFADDVLKPPADQLRPYAAGPPCSQDAASDKRIDFLRQPRQSRRGDRHAYRAHPGERRQARHHSELGFQEPQLYGAHAGDAHIWRARRRMLRPTIRAVIAARRSGRTPSQTTHSTVKVWSRP